ncbi:hypothetical protein ACRAWC_02570 [Leifsonia sp. L25]
MSTGPAPVPSVVHTIRGARFAVATARGFGRGRAKRTIGLHAAVAGAW